MNKYEFLEGLKAALADTNNPVLIKENVDFYKNYIEDELKKSRDEEDILAELGEPRLIARSIKEAAGIDDEFLYEDVHKGKSFWGDSENNGESAPKGFVFSGKSVIWIMLALILIFIIIVVIVGSIIYLLAPFLLVVIAVFWVLRIFSGRRR